MITLILFTALLLVLVLSHEAGHFFVARAFGIKVEEFGFGIPPRIWSLWRDAKGTLYSLNLLPFGGFVKIFGEEGEDTAKQGSFGSKPAWQRFLVLFSGVFANILLAYFVFSFLAFWGLPEGLSDEEALKHNDSFILITNISQGSPAAIAGFEIGDKINKIKNVSDVQKFIKESAGKEIILNVTRGSQDIEIKIIPRKNPPDGEGPLGVELALARIARTPWYLAPIEGAKLTWQIFSGTIFGFWDLLKNLIFGLGNKVEVAGPVGIFRLTESAQRLGFVSMLMFLALLSVNLGILNVLPIPGLDGGRIFFLFIETIRGRQISPKISSVLHGAGLAILIILMLIVTYYDIVRVF